jgi:hypothetical protein
MGVNRHFKGYLEGLGFYVYSVTFVWLLVADSEILGRYVFIQAWIPLGGNVLDHSPEYDFKIIVSIP